MKNEELIKQLTTYEKASLLVGYTNMTTRPIERLGIPSLVMSDGPNGVRREGTQKDPISGALTTQKATCFPCGSLLAQSFDDELMYEIGKQIARECKYYKINAILGPAINIKRNPLCGRNFEYLSEDPYLSGKLAANYIKGVQDEGVIACVKHYACNNLEEWRYVGDSIVDLRALNEIYLRSFEYAIKEANPGMVMTAYNQINGQFASENLYTQKLTLRERWGYDGLTVTDWGGMVQNDRALNAGQDLEMPGVNEENIQVIVKGVESGLVTEERLNEAVLHLLKCIERTRNNETIGEEVFEESNKVALKAAVSGAVLLKNEGGVLPLNKTEKIAIVGDLFDFLRFQGGGSAIINAKEINDNKMAFDQLGIDYKFVKGYDSFSRNVDSKLEKTAIKVCKDFETIVFFGGLTDLSESEGFDRPHMRLEKNQIHLINELAKLNKRLVCVFFGGAVFEIPQFEKINSILYMNLPGQMGGLAVAKLLFGEESPSGRLAVTWPVNYNQVPFSKDFARTPDELYKESIFVGYRYFETKKEPVLFPFGFGLTYGETSCSNFKISIAKENIHIAFDIKNLSKVSIKEVVQVYVGMTTSNVSRAEKELKKYLKIPLSSLEEKHIEIDVPIKDLAIYSTSLDRFAVEEGEYIISVSRNARDDLFKEKIAIKGEKIPVNEIENQYLNINTIDQASLEDFEKLIGRKIIKNKYSKRPYNFKTPISLYSTLGGRIVRHEMQKIGNDIIKDAKKIKDEQERKRQIKSGYFVKRMVVQNSLRSLYFSSGGLLKKSQAEGILDVANGHIIRGFKKYKQK